METSTEIKDMAKEYIPGLMVQDLKVTLRMTRRKVLEHLSSLVEINLRFVHEVVFNFLISSPIMRAIGLKKSATCYLIDALHAEAGMVQWQEH